MFLWWSSTKIVQAIWIPQKTWPLGGEAYFPYIENFKNLLVRNHWTDFNIIFSGMFLWWSSTKIVQATMIQGLFSLYIYIENFKNLLVINDWTDFNITWQKCFFSDPLSRLFKPSWFVKKHGRWGAGTGAGLLFPIYLYRKLEKILSSETTGLISI